jgi:uncharacterized membrane protein
MTLESSKNLGGIGAILLVIGAPAFFVQPILSVIGIVGIVLMLISLNGLSGYYQERGIFANALYGFIALIIGVIVTFAAIAYLLFYTSFITDLVSTIYPGFNGDWSTLPNLNPNTNVNPNYLIPFIGPILSIVAFLWIFIIIDSFFIWRSLKTLAWKSTVSLFATAGILLLIGSFLVIAFGLGLLLMWIGVFLMAIAFFKLKQLPEQPISPTPYPMQTTV